MVGIPAMAISLFSNVAEDRAVLNVNRVADDLAKVTQRLSSGLQVRTDALAGYVVADQLETTIRSLQGADSNIQAALAALDLSDTALETINDGLGDLIDLATQASNGLLTDAQRAPL